ncbi:MAG: Fe-S cluster assembly ATPase SufC [Candidatus Peregrinibacteria bacterium]
MLSITNLTAELDHTPILRGITLSVLPQELHLMLGLNGSGKSTFGKVLLGHPHYTKTGGTIELLGEEISALPTHERAKRGIFLSHQNPPEIEGVSAQDVFRAADKEREKRSIMVFKKVLQENLKKSHLPLSFLSRPLNVGASGGERKKMEMASLLTLGARLAFLDEIDSGLDIDAVKAVAEGINAFLENGKNAVILVSHSAGILQYVKPTRVHIFCGGRIMKSGGMELAERVFKDGYEGLMDCEECSTVRGHALNP